MRILALGLASAAVLCAQYRHHFSWQEACFNNPGAPYCQGHEYAVKPQPAKKDPPSSKSVVSNPFASTERSPAATIVEVGGIDWHFADPSADALLGINVGGLSSSPLERKLISQLGAGQGLGEADMQKILSGLSQVDQIAISVRNDRAAMMITGPVADLPASGIEPGMKAVAYPGAMLVGHADAVDQAAQRITAKGPSAELTALAQQLQGGCEFWAVGSASAMGPQAGSLGLKRFTLAVWVRDSVMADLALEFNEAPTEKTLNMLRASNPVSVEGNVVHLRMSAGRDDVQQKFAPFVSSPAGQRLAALVRAAQYLPPRPATASKAKAVIYGLDEGPREIN